MRLDTLLYCVGMVGFSCLGSCGRPQAKQTVATQNEQVAHIQDTAHSQAAYGPSSKDFGTNTTYVSDTASLQDYVQKSTGVAIAAVPSALEPSAIDMYKAPRHSLADAKGDKQQPWYDTALCNGASYNGGGDILCMGRPDHTYHTLLEGTSQSLKSSLESPGATEEFSGSEDDDLPPPPRNSGGDAIPPSQ